MKYLIVIEETSTGFSAYSPDIDGCVATGATKEEVEKNIDIYGEMIQGVINSDLSTCMIKVKPILK